ncbi:MAG TPA: ATP-binding protein [Opitutaceae bacterium]
MLAQSSLSAEQRECLGLIRSSGESLLHTIDDLLDLTKVDAGHLELDPQAFDPRVLIRDTVRSLGAIAAEKKLTFEVSFTEAIPPALVADSARLRQILINLVGNALKFTERGRVHVHADIVDGPEPGSTPGSVYLQIAVRDTGIGIPREKLADLFQPFRQLDASTSRRYGGTGLGLAISRRLCELMGGAISVETVEGRGSTFHFRIAAGRAPVPASTERHLCTIETVMPSVDTPPLRILLVEDNPVNALVALKMLRFLGYTADHARNGHDALRVFDERHHDLVLMDLQMPGMDGWATTRHLRSREGDAQPWIIALTADAMDGVRERCLAAGMNGYLTKPLVLERLAAELSRAIGAHAVAPGGLSGTTA